MKILIVSALYPPDVEDPAPYIKELATRLRTEHTVSVLTYGTLPEQIAHVEINAVSKNIPAVMRLAIFTKKLFVLSRRTDVVLLQNAPSTEFPALFASLIYRSKFRLHISDQKIIYRGWRAFIHRLISIVVNYDTITSLPLAKPEIHPLNPFPTEAFAAYEQSWQDHLRMLRTHFS